MSRVLTFILSALMLSAPALAQTAPGQRTIYQEKPTGTGDPSAVSCYPSAPSTSRVKKLDCRPNSEWATMNAAENRGDRTDPRNVASAPANIIH